MKKIRVAYVLESCESWQPARRVAAAADALPSDEFDVEVISPQSRSFGEGVRLAGHKADVLHLADAWSVAAVGPWLPLRRRGPYTVTVSDFRRETTWLRRRTERFVYRRAAAVVAADSAVAERRRAECGLTDAPLWPVIDVRSLLPISSAAADRPTVCRELDVPLDAKLIGAFGPLTTAQNMRDVVWLEALLRLLYEDTFIVLFGVGPKLAALKQFAAAMHVSDRVRFVTDAAAFDRVVPQLTIYIDAARWSGPSAALFAAQECGIPSIAIDTPVRRGELLADRSGYLIAEHDRAALTRRCYKLLEDESLRTSFSTVAREFAATVRRSKSSTAATLADLYRRAVRLT